MRCECSSPFQGTAANKVQLTTVHGQLYHSYKVSPTLYQTDLRITNHKGHKFPPSLNPLFIQNSNRMASRLTAAAIFPSVVFELLQYSRQHPSFSAHRAALMTKTDLTYPAFLCKIWGFCCPILLLL